MCGDSSDFSVRGNPTIHALTCALLELDNLSKQLATPKGTRLLCPKGTRLLRPKGTHLFCPKGPTCYVDIEGCVLDTAQCCFYGSGDLPLIQVQVVSNRPDGEVNCTSQLQGSGGHTVSIIRGSLLGGSGGHTEHYKGVTSRRVLL